MANTQFDYEPAPQAYVEGFAKQDYDRVMESLADDPSQATQSFGFRNTTLLHAACYDGRPEIVELLIQLGADVNAQEKDGRSPLHHAANNAHLDVIDILVRNGANLEAKDGRGMTPLMWGKISRSGDNDEIVNKLLDYGARDVAEESH